MNNMDKDGAKINVFVRIPFIEYEALFPAERKAKIMASKGPEERNPFNTIQEAERMKSPRLIKTHLPLSMLPPNLLDTCKVVYVCRNPMDTCVSYYHHNYVFDVIYDYKDSFENFEKYFRKGQLMYGSYWYHLKVSSIIPLAVHL